MYHVIHTGNISNSNARTLISAAYNADTVHHNRKEEITDHRAKEDKKVTKEVPDLLKRPDIISEDKIILVAAYMRTGSSLTGSIFKSYPGAFYVRELMGPLVSSFKALSKKNAKTLTLRYLNGTTRYVYFLLNNFTFAINHCALN